MNIKKNIPVLGLPCQRKISVPTFHLLLLIFACLTGMEALRMTALRIPLHVVLNETVRMECDFNLDQETLYSVKWYKDGHEFYRYVPMEQPDVHVFALPGVFVDKRRSSEKLVVLQRVNRNSTGRYRCEVSAEAPAFHTVSEHADMTVVVLPERGPTITASHSKYNVGDLVRMNCTSAPSKPPASLTWYINDERVNGHFLKGPRKVREDSNGLVVIQLGLEFRAWQKYFNRGDMKLRCLARISSVYERSNERQVIGDERFVKQPLESRETRAQSHTRGDYNASESRASVPSTIVLSTLSTFVVCYFRR